MKDAVAGMSFWRGAAYLRRTHFFLPAHVSGCLDIPFYLKRRLLSRAHPTHKLILPFSAFVQRAMTRASSFFAITDCIHKALRANLYTNASEA